MGEITSIIMHIDSHDAIDCLSDEQAGQLFKAILCYAATGKQPETKDKALLALFNIFKAQIDRDRKKYEEKCMKYRENARKSHMSKNETSLPPATASDGMPSQTMACVSNSKSNSTPNCIDDNDINGRTNTNAVIYSPRIDEKERRKRVVYSSAAKAIDSISQTPGNTSCSDRSAQETPHH